MAPVDIAVINIHCLPAQQCLIPYIYFKTLFTE